ncbi:hypothetical protein RU87_GL000539 [Lactococcus plantarum]|uniref:Lactococcin 972 family bacteriocin n=2 Tax=Pseudolactococcus plantarum TaxID=1365 RepID=A0A2A5RW84_9LACT|nr:hypothetical protein RU87_GL000539 [Lactococcus plantarum]
MKIVATQKGENKMKKTKKLVAIGTLCLMMGTAAAVSAVVTNPAPLPIIDVWSYGTANGGKRTYSHYYVKSAGYGSVSSVKNSFGRVKSSAKIKYGWARSDANKSWNDGVLSAHWGYYTF